MAREIKTKSAAGLMILIVLAIIIILNLISVNLFSRIDLTDDGIYSLAESSIGLMRNLNDRITVKVYITDDLPAPHNGHARYLKDMLDDYRAYSGGYLHYEFIDPARDGKEDEARGYRIPTLQFNVFRNDKTEFIKGYKGIVLLYGDRQEVIPFFENTSNLEYDLTLAMKKLTSTKIPSIGFTIGHGEPDISAGLQTAYQILQEEYRVQFIDLNNVRDIPHHIEALFIVAPKQDFSEWELYLIDQFIMRGGRVAFLIDRLDIDIARGIVSGIDNTLYGLMNSYGIGIKEQLVIDASCNMIPVMRDMGRFKMQSMVKYPFYPVISGFNSEIPIVKDIKRLNILFMNPLDLNHMIADGCDRQILFTSSAKSGVRSLPVDISPEKQYRESDFDREYIPLGAVLTGRFESYFTNREIPAYTGPDTLSETPIPEKTLDTDDSRVVVIGNGTFITDDYRRNQAGFVILMNIADWMTQDEGLISIRSKQVTARTLDVVSDAAKPVIKYINMFGMTILVVLFGLVRWRIKRSSQKAREQIK